MPSLQWFTELTQRERRTLYAGFGGYAVDAFDFMIYSFLIPTLIATWGMTKSEAGMIATSFPAFRADMERLGAQFS